MKFIPHYSPIAVHYGAIDTRILQLKSKSGSWSVEASGVYSSSGTGRHANAAEKVKQELNRLKLHGKDALLAISSSSTSINLVPIEADNHNRMEQTMQDTAARSLKDPEGICYRYLPMSNDENGLSRDEYLLLATGSSELRRSQNAAEALGLRPCGIEASAFPIARALSAVHSDSNDPWGFLHIGFNHSLFGIVQQGEMKFLKPMQLTAETLFNKLQNCIEGFACEQTIESSDLFAPVESDETDDPMNATCIATMHRNSVGHAVDILHGLRTESESLAQELRACLRHFATRNKGVHMGRIDLCGIGASLPEVENALSAALSLPIQTAKPFTELSINAPDEVMAEEHMWCSALGLAMRGYE